MTRMSPHFSPSPLRKHAQTCHLHCSALLTHSCGICSPHNGLKESPDPEVEGQVTSYTQSGTGTWTWQPITSTEVVWAGLFWWYTVFCLYKHKLKGDLEGPPKLGGGTWMAVTFIHMKRSMQIWVSYCVYKLSICSHWDMEGNYSNLNICRHNHQAQKHLRFKNITD